MSRGTKRAATETSLSPRKSKTPKLVEEGLSIRLLELIDKKHEKLGKALDYKFQRIFQTMETTKNDIINELANMREEMQNLNNSVSKLEKDVECSNNLKSVVESLQEQVETLHNKAISSELRILGVPWVANENLHTVFNKICEALNIETPNTISIHRVKRNDSGEGPIIVKLTSANERNQLMRSLALYRRNNNNKGMLRLNNIGFESDSPIYVNENLTSRNNNIMRAVSKYKREKTIAAAYTLRGSIFIKLHNNNSPIAINSMDVLDDVISNLFRNT